MKRTITIIFLTVCLAAAQRVMASGYAAMTDSIAPDPEDEDYISDTTVRRPKRTATGENAMDYALEPRFVPEGESFSGKWYDHMTLEAGMGLMGIAANSDHFRINTITSVHGGISKTLGKLHTVRLALDGGFGKEKYGGKRLYLIGGRADYLFNVTAATRGYNPSRRFETSVILGTGLMLTKLQGQAKRVSPEVHAGLQFKVVTSPYASLLAEPYVGLTMDKMDYSHDNWRKYDVFYGINLGIAHYLTKNYSPRSHTDSITRLPWFVETAMGPSAYFGKGGSKSVAARNTIGLRMSWTVGKWLSPIVGMKFSAFMGSNGMAEAKDKNGFMRNTYMTSCGGQIDAMINPFGFSRRFSWDARFGGYLLGGVGVGMINRLKSEKFISASAGAHLFAAIDPDLQLFVEPRYSEYRHKGLRDRNVSVAVGLTAMARSMRYRTASALTDDDDVSDGVPVTVGLSLTMPVMMMQGTAYADKNLSYGMKAFGQYRFTDISAVRLSVDYMSLSRAAGSPYLEQYAQGDDLMAKSRYGVMNRRHGLLIATAAYSLDVCRLLSGSKVARLFRTELYAGPGAAVYLYDKVTAIEGMNLPEGHTVKNNTRHTVKTYFSFTGGVKMSHDFSRNWGIYLEPSLHAVMNMKMAGIQTISFAGNKMQIIPSVSLGAQYTL